MKNIKFFAVLSALFLFTLNLSAQTDTVFNQITLDVKRIVGTDSITPEEMNRILKMLNYRIKATETLSIPKNTKGVVNGVAPLDATGKVPVVHIPVHGHVQGDVINLSSDLAAIRAKAVADSLQDVYNYNYVDGKVTAETARATAAEANAVKFGSNEFSGKGVVLGKYDWLQGVTGLAVADSGTHTSSLIYNLNPEKQARLFINAVNRTKDTATVAIVAAFGREYPQGQFAWQKSGNIAFYGGSSKDTANVNFASLLGQLKFWVRDYNVLTFSENAAKFTVSVEMPSLKATQGVQVTGGVVVFPSYTTSQRDNLTAVAGTQIFNITVDKMQVRTSTAWVDLH